ncbi:MAG: hypothetical protein AAFR20_10485 [Pseudomonadota bacterium]
MDFRRLYLSSAGVINRKVWWLGLLGIIVIGFFASIFIGLLIALVGLGTSRLALNAANLAVSLGTAFLFYTLSVKRLRERGRTLNLALVFSSFMVLTPVLQLFGITGGIEEQVLFGQPIEMFTPNGFGQALGLVNFAIGLWAMIELGVIPARPDHANGVSAQKDG